MVGKNHLFHVGYETLSAFQLYFRYAMPAIGSRDGRSTAIAHPGGGEQVVGLAEVEDRWQGPVGWQV